MGNTWPKLIRDPVHDIISFEDKPWDHLLLNLINTREFQRLRRIKQLGMSEMVFPGANHSRFAHAIGVMHNARRFLARIEQLTGRQVDVAQRTAVLTAALLHDLGHGPFSHTFEKITGESHEKRTAEIILDPATAVNRVLAEHDRQLPETLRQFFDEDIDRAADGVLPRYLVQIVSSQLDADRFDYLPRDAHATGADYGRFDSRWIIQHLVLDEHHKRLHLSNKAFIAAETYVFARYHMYRAVYFHKTTRAAEVMLKLMFRRYKELLEGTPAGRQRSVVRGVPAAILKAFANGGNMALQDYLSLDDHTVTEFMKACLLAKDAALSRLANGLLNRDLFKAIDVTDADQESVGEFVSAAKESTKAHPLGPDATFVSDRAADTPYKPYDPDAGEPAAQIYVEDGFGKPVEFSRLSDAVRDLQKKYTLLRYYFPADVREEIERIGRVHLRQS